MAKGLKNLFGGKKEVTPPESQIGKQAGADITIELEKQLENYEVVIDDKKFKTTNSNSEPSTELGRIKKETGLTGKALLIEWKNRKLKANGKAK